MFFSVDIATPMPGTDEPYRFSVPVFGQFLIDCKGSANTVDDLLGEVTKAIHRAAEQHLANDGEISQLDMKLHRFDSSFDFVRDDVILLDISMDDVIQNTAAIQLPTPLVEALTSLIEGNQYFNNVESFVLSAIADKRERMKSVRRIINAKKVLADKLAVEKPKALMQYIVYLYTNGKQAPKPEDIDLELLGAEVLDAIKLLTEAKGSPESLKEYYEPINERMEVIEQVS
ncbi:hypothetical protein [Pseudoalteromonas sp. MEBiC 03485]|uniref:hypothetical protein n=1 Tax=Pseudoalteromonas sp. MEBiC 03485 TaxID=2571103 RepID=UPI00101EB110|nr:hypothetical protein [Pseudoalteromonas sp. MEBiC 03485]RZD19746.1 hypothetical protein EVU92_21320 [Pseudoalteromonas sp. MEBiC 03485]